MRVLIALGGNALLRRGQPMTVENQRANVAVACEHLAKVASEHQVVISHGNGPQIGLLALEGAAYVEVPVYPMDVLGAETQGMIGYLIQEELRNRLPKGSSVATLLTMVEVDADDPAFLEPSKPIGPLYDAVDAEVLRTQRGWTFAPDGAHLRRVVPSPKPKRILEHVEISALVDRGCTVICAGGGGIPTAIDGSGRIYGVEAVIDKDFASGLLATDLSADVFVMATDTASVFVNFATPEQRPIIAAHPDAILAQHAAEFARGSMLPKVTAACEFAQRTGRLAVIGQLSDIVLLTLGLSGTRISTSIDGVILGDPVEAKEH